MVVKHKSGESGLDRAVQHLIEAQALSQAQIAQSNSEISRLDREIREDMAAIKATLAWIVRALEHLPEAVREKIGFAKS